MIDKIEIFRGKVNYVGPQEIAMFPEEFGLVLVVLPVPEDFFEEVVDPSLDSFIVLETFNVQFQSKVGPEKGPLFFTDVVPNCSPILRSISGAWPRVGGKFMNFVEEIFEGIGHFDEFGDVV